MCSCSWQQVAQADEIRGKVVSIADGDTVTVLYAEKVQHKMMMLTDTVLQNRVRGEKYERQLE